MTEQAIKIGDRVSVTLPGGEYTGKVRKVIENFNWTGETAYEVEGSEPVEFITSARNVTKAQEGA